MMQELLEKIETQIQPLYGLGKVADYIPELAKVNPRQFAMTVISLDGNEYSVGNFNQPFSIQSISKVFVLSMAMKLVADELWSKVGKEPSGTAFNSLVQLEKDEGKPRNPFLNSGALVTTDTIVHTFDNPLEKIRNFVRELSGNESIDYNDVIAESEYSNRDRNAALAHFVKSYGHIISEVDELLQVYFHHCSLYMSTRDLAQSFLYLANHGVNPQTGEQVLSRVQTKRINSLMLTCGLYDNVGDFAFHVGLPAKSGVGGGIAAVMPESYAVAVWSPELNSCGNSTIGSKALELLTNETELSIF